MVDSAGNYKEDFKSEKVNAKKSNDTLKFCNQTCIDPWLFLSPKKPSNPKLNNSLTLVKDIRFLTTR